VDLAESSFNHSSVESFLKARARFRIIADRALTRAHQCPAIAEQANTLRWGKTLSAVATRWRVGKGLYAVRKYPASEAFAKEDGARRAARVDVSGVRSWQPLPLKQTGIVPSRS